MSNTFNLGGSPLGLIGVKSRPTPDGMSTFNGGESRNINVSSYNLGAKQRTNISVGGQNIESTVSLFTGDSIPKFWGNISTLGTDLDKTGTSREYNGINRNTLHNDDVYDTSILNIIEKLSFSNKASLRPQDFAYLKNLGVFPNNRLMIARRFSEPQKDNIMDKSGNRPLSVLISWKPENEEFIKFNYGEEWEDADADFTGILNSLGENFRIDKLGEGLSVGLNITPLKGFTELIQRKLLTDLGILENLSDDIDNQPLPSGNPNIIKMAKKRKTFGYSQSGSGLKANITIKMVVEYEQKFISGIDPTVAWMDILNNALVFGTSNSSKYGLSSKFAENIKRWTGKNGISNLINDFIKILSKSFSEFKDNISDLILNSTVKIDIKNLSESELLEYKENAINKFTEKLDLVKRSVQESVRKYQVELLGVAHSLSGLSSTPWHITIGNPLRPVFCSGDMLVEQVDVDMGPTLAFNDLPSTIKVEFTMKNARPLGLQEILAKFNTGYLRTVNNRKDYLSAVFSNDGNAYYESIANNESNQVAGSSTGTSIGNNLQEPNKTTKENE